MGKHTWKIIILVIVLLFGGSILYSQQVAKEANKGVVIESHIKGNPDASVTLVEYSDFECPACGQFFPYVQDLLAEHESNIRFEYKHFPLINIHPFAIPAARAAEAAGQQGKFFEMHDKLFENQSVWAKSAAPSVYFEQYAEEIGLDVSLFTRHTDSSLIGDAITDSFNEARAMGLTSTPTFFLNGEQMQFTSFDDFVAQVDAAVAAENGTPEASNTESFKIEL